VSLKHSASYVCTYREEKFKTLDGCLNERPGFAWAA